MNVLITGGASGIGLASALYFSERGHRVFTIDVKDAEKNTGVEHFVSDITDEDTLIGVKKALSDRDIRLDAIISVAGIHTMQSLVEGETDGMKRLIDINLFGAMLTVRVFHEMLVEKGRVIIVTSEVATYTPMPFNGLYNVSKTALDCYADALRQELNLLHFRVRHQLQLHFHFVYF